MQIHHLVQMYGYWGMIFALCVEYLGVPFPAETLLTIAGFQWQVGTFHFIPLYISVIAGTFTGSILAYFIGAKLGRPILLRYGKYIGITDEKLNQADLKFQKYTAALLLFSRFIAGIRVLTPYLAGMNRTPIRIFSIYSLIGSAVWAFIFLFIGRFLSNEWVKYHHLLRHYWLPAVLIVSISALLVWLLKSQIHSKKKKEIQNTHSKS